MSSSTSIGCLQRFIRFAAALTCLTAERNARGDARSGRFGFFIYGPFDAGREDFGLRALRVSQPFTAMR